MRVVRFSDHLYPRVVSKLRALGGWDHELDDMAPLYKGIKDHLDVNKPQELTERSVF